MNPRPTVNPRLGALVRRERERAGMSLRDLATNAGIHYSGLHLIEQGRVQSPDPVKLRAIALALGIDPQDLYALSGYTVPDRLPHLAPYLRSKYDLPDAAIDELESYFNQLQARYGFGEGDDDLGT